MRLLGGWSGASFTALTVLYAQETEREEDLLVYLLVP